MICASLDFFGLGLFELCELGVTHEIPLMTVSLSGSGKFRLLQRAGATTSPLVEC